MIHGVFLMLLFMGNVFPGCTHGYFSVLIGFASLSADSGFDDSTALMTDFTTAVFSA